MKSIDFSKFTDGEIIQKINECKDSIKKLEIMIGEEHEFLNQVSMEYGKRKKTGS